MKNQGMKGNLVFTGNKREGTHIQCNGQHSIKQNIIFTGDLNGF